MYVRTYSYVYVCGDQLLKSDESQVGGRREITTPQPSQYFVPTGTITRRGQKEEEEMPDTIQTLIHTSIIKDYVASGPINSQILKIPRPDHSHRVQL